MEILSASKQGSKTNFIISGASKDQFNSAVRGRVYENRDGHLEVTAGNKRDAASVRRIIEDSIHINQPAQANQSRYIAPLETAERNGLNHGRSWVCKEMDIQTKGVNPALEGELICYVYC